MSNSPRPPRPPRPGAGTRPGAPRRPSAGPAPGAPAPADFGDTRTVILSRKSMSMQQTLKDDKPAGGAAPAPAAAPSLPKAKVENNNVFCVSCSASFPIVSDEFYGAVVECPDCSAEFQVPSKAEAGSAAPAATPAPAPAAKPAPAPAAATPAPAATQTQVQAAPAAKKSSNKKPVRNVPDFIAAELADDEDVFVLKKGSLGNKAVVPAVVAGLGGIVAGVMGGTPVTMGVGIGLGVVGIVLSFVMGKGGEAALAITENKAVVVAGDFSAEAKID